MKKICVLTGLAVISLRFISASFAQGAPDIVWEVPTPNGLASIVGVGWAPGVSGQVAMGSTDRWLRTREAADGKLNYSIPGPQQSRGGDQTIYSVDGEFLAVHNINSGLDYRVYRVNDGLFLGTILVTIDSHLVVHFVPDAQLQSSVPKDATMMRWRLDQFTVVSTTGSGSQMMTTTYNFSPNGRYQSVARFGLVQILARKTGALVSCFCGGNFRGFTPASFTPDSSAFAAWDPDSNLTTLFRVSNGTILMQFCDLFLDEGLNGIRFSPDGARMVTSGYYAFVDNGGVRQQYGYIRFWGVANGALRQQFNQHTGMAVTSAIALSPDASQFIYGTSEGGVVVAHTPAP